MDVRQPSVFLNVFLRHRNVMCLSSVLMKVWGLQNAEESADSEWVRQYIYSDLTDFSKQCSVLPTYTVCPITLPSSPSVSHCDSLCPENLPRSRLPSVCTSRCCFSSPGERGWPRSRCELPMPPSATFPADVEENERLNEVCYRPIRVLLWLFMQLWAEL